MRYFLDCEYNGFRGAILSLALVPEDGGEDFYLTFGCDDAIDRWVERHVLPYLAHVPDALKLPSMTREQGAQAIAMYLGGDDEPAELCSWADSRRPRDALSAAVAGQLQPRREQRCSA
jgi:hypothetical protein